MSADLDTFRELAEELRKLKEKGSEAPEALVSKITEFKTALDGIREQMTALNNADLEAAYQRGRA